MKASAVFYIGFLYFRTQINSQINGNKFVCFRSSCVGKRLAQFACGLLELIYRSVVIQSFCYKYESTPSNLGNINAGKTHSGDRFLGFQ